MTEPGADTPRPSRIAAEVDNDGQSGAGAHLIVTTFVPTSARWAIGTDRRPIWLRVNDTPTRLERDRSLHLTLTPGTYDLAAAPSAGVTLTPTDRQWARHGATLHTHIGEGHTAIVVVIATSLGLKIGSLARCHCPPHHDRAES